MTTADRFRAAVDNRDLAALDDLFTEDVRLYSPVKFTPFEGRPMVLGLFGVLLRTFEDFRYVGQLRRRRGDQHRRHRGPVGGPALPRHRERQADPRHRPAPVRRGRTGSRSSP